MELEISTTQQEKIRPKKGKKYPMLAFTNPTAEIIKKTIQ